MKKYLGIEFGSTRIKAVVIDDKFRPVASGDSTWTSELKNGVWTYDLNDAWAGLKAALRGVGDPGTITAAGVSGMMHGYLAFDSDWNLLTPFRTWQNTVTQAASDELTALFNFPVPQRWSVSHLYQAVLNNEEHIRRVAHITTLAGYIHFCLTGVNAVGLGDASGMFPIDPDTINYNKGMADKFDRLMQDHGLPLRIRELLPTVFPAGSFAGQLTEKGSELINGLLPAGIPFAPPEGDGATGMTASNAVAPGYGSVSAGTSIFALVVLDRPLGRVYDEINIINTPTGKPAAMAHGCNCTGDFNSWASVFSEVTQLFASAPTTNELFTNLYNKSLEGQPDCGGVTVCNYLTGEDAVGINVGRPLIVRTPDSEFSLANLLRAMLYSTMSTLRLGMDVLRRENIEIHGLTGHGGLFKTPLVGQKYLAAACNTPITCMTTAGEGGPFGMALLAAFCSCGGDLTLEDFLNGRVFAEARSTTVAPDPADVAGFDEYMNRYKKLLEIERAAATVF